MIKIFDVTHPGCQMLIFFDQSSAHNVFSPDALNASRMNANPGRAQPCMHSTTIPMSNPNPELRGQVQYMVFPDDHENAGKAKGMIQVLQEQGLWTTLMVANNNKAPLARCIKCRSSKKKRAELEKAAQARVASNPKFIGSFG